MSADINNVTTDIGKVYVNDLNSLDKHLSTLNRILANKGLSADNRESIIKEMLAAIKQANTNIRYGTEPKQPTDTLDIGLNPYAAAGAFIANTAGDILNTYSENVQLRNSSVADSMRNDSNRIANSYISKENPFIYMNAIANGVETRGKTRANNARTAGQAFKNLGSLMNSISGSKVATKLLQSGAPGMGMYGASQMSKNVTNMYR